MRGVASGSGSGAIPTMSAQLPSRVLAGAIESAVLGEQIRQQMPSTPSRGASTRRREDTSDEQPSKEKANIKQSVGAEKKRKPTYYMRKDEMAQLKNEVVELEAALTKAQGLSHGGVPAQDQTQREEAQSLVGAMATTADLHDRVRRGDLAIASAQSLVASYGSQCQSSPIGGFIHLPMNPIQRQQTLTTLKMPRMHEAIAYALTRSRFLTAARCTKQMDTFETDSGDFVTTLWETTPLPEARSVQHAYRELLYFLDTQEMSMSETLGVLTIRESESDPVEGVQTLRMLSTHEGGAQSETNLALFTHYFEHSEMLKQPHALLVTDYIDQDDMYPRQPQTRIHTDVSSFTMITEAPSTTRDGHPTVTMVQWAFVRLNNSAYTNRSELEVVAREAVGKWCDVMLTCVRERLAWRS